MHICPPAHPQFTCRPGAHPCSYLKTPPSPLKQPGPGTRPRRHPTRHSLLFEQAQQPHSTGCQPLLLSQTRLAPLLLVALLLPPPRRPQARQKKETSTTPTSRPSPDHTHEVTTTAAVSHSLIHTARCSDSAPHLDTGTTAITTITATTTKAATPPRSRNGTMGSQQSEKRRVPRMRKQADRHNPPTRGDTHDKEQYKEPQPGPTRNAKLHSRGSIQSVVSVPGARFIPSNTYPTTNTPRTDGFVQQGLAGLCPFGPANGSDAPPSGAGNAGNPPRKRTRLKLHAQTLLPTVATKRTQPLLTDTERRRGSKRSGTFAANPPKSRGPTPGGAPVLASP